MDTVGRGIAPPIFKNRKNDENSKKNLFIFLKKYIDKSCLK